MNAIAFLPGAGMLGTPLLLWGGLTWVADKLGISRYIILVSMLLVAVIIGILYALSEAQDASGLLTSVPEQEPMPSWNKGAIVATMHAITGYIGWTIACKIIDTGYTGNESGNNDE